MRRDGTSLAVLAIALFVGQAGTDAADARQRQVVCGFSAVDRVLTIKVRPEPDGLPPEFDEILPRSGAAGVGLDGGAFDVRDAADRRVVCEGGEATPAGVDTIRMLRAGGNDQARLVLDMRRGPFGPGATDEGGGGSEIEVEADLGRFGTALAILTPTPDEVHVGRVAGLLAANLNPAEPAPDADLIASSGNISVVGGPGADTLTGALSPGFDPTPVERRYSGFALIGGGGADLVIGTDGGDFIDGGSGVDTLIGRAGEDLVWGRDHTRERVACGPDRDWAIVDRDDRRSGCEKRSFEDPFGALEDFDRRVAAAG